MRKSVVMGLVAVGIFAAGGLGGHLLGSQARPLELETRFGARLIAADVLEQVGPRKPRVQLGGAENAEPEAATEAEPELEEPEPEPEPNRYGVKGPENVNPHIARKAALRDATELGMIGLLNSGSESALGADKDGSLGKDPLSARGNMWGDSIGESFGAGGLGLSGIGEGGGGRGESIGLGSIGAIGHGASTGYGTGSGRLGSSYGTRKKAKVRGGSASVKGSLDSATIKRIITAHNSRFRLCYQTGLRGNSKLSGKVDVRFVISRTGSVSTVSTGGSLPSSSVKSCIRRAFYSLTFPKPNGGIVNVKYPLVFSDGGTATKKSTKAKKPAKAKTSTKVKARVRSVRVGTGLDSKVVQERLKKSRRAFRKCYRAALASDPNLSGTVHLKFEVTNIGTVIIGKKSEAIVSTVSRALADCVLDSLDDIAFPAVKPGKSGTVSFKVSFWKP